MELSKCDLTKPYVFVCYAHANKEKVHSDASELQKRGCNVWIDAANMVGGKSVEQTDDIIRKENCKALIFYMCEKSVCSEYCLPELRTAKKYEIPIIPIHCFSIIVGMGLKKTILSMQRNMDFKREQVKTSDFILDILEKNGSETISIPYDTPNRIDSIIESLMGNDADSVIEKHTESLEPITTQLRIPIYEQGKIVRETAKTILKNAGYVLDDSLSTEYTIGKFVPQKETKEIIEINLNNRNITDELLTQMITTGIIPKNVKRLHLENNLISDLSPLCKLNNLTVVWLSGNPIDDNQVSRLRKAFPNCLIICRYR